MGKVLIKDAGSWKNVREMVIKDVNSWKNIFGAQYPSYSQLSTMNSIINKMSINGNVAYSADLIDTQLTGNAKYLGAILAPTGDVFFCPGPGATQFMLANPSSSTTNQVSFFGTVPDSGYGRAQLGDNGRIYFFPASSNDTYVTEVNPQSLEITNYRFDNTNLLNLTNYGIVGMNDNMLVGANSTIGKFNPTNKMFYASTVLPGNSIPTTSNYIGTVNYITTTSIGWVNLSRTTNGHQYNYLTSTYSSIPNSGNTTITASKYQGAIYSPRRNQVICPGYTMNANVTSLYSCFYNVDSNAALALTSSHGSKVSQAFYGGAVGPDGSVLLTPHNATKVEVFDSAYDPNSSFQFSKTFNVMNTVGNDWAGGTMVYNGYNQRNEIFLAPYDSRYILKIVCPLTSSYTPLTLAECCHRSINQGV